MDHASSTPADEAKTKQPNWVARHKVLSSIGGVIIVSAAVAQVGEDPASGSGSGVSRDSSTVAASTLATPAAASPTVADTAQEQAAAKKSAEAAAKEESEAQAAAKKSADAAAKDEAEAQAAAKKSADAAAKKEAEAQAAAKKSADAAAKKEADEARLNERDTFDNCTDMNQTYAHGVGLAGARDQASGRPVTTFKVSERIYRLNEGSDRDGDGIACEKL